MRPIIQTAIFALCLVAGTSTFASPTHLYGQTSIDMAADTEISWYGLSGTVNGVGFGSGQLFGTPNCATPGCETTYTRSATATLLADPGFIIDKVYISILYGGYGNFGASSSSSTLDWNINGGTYSGKMHSDTPCAYSGSDYRCWSVTGPSSGQAIGTGYAWFATVGGQAQAVEGFYDIQAASFSIDLMQLVNFYNPSYWAGNMDPIGMTLGMSLISAPIPEPETYAMMLAGLGMLGFLARRRKQREPAA